MTKIWGLSGLSRNVRQMWAFIVIYFVAIMVLLLGGSRMIQNHSAQIDELIIRQGRVHQFMSDKFGSEWIIYNQHLDAVRSDVMRERERLERGE